MFNYTSGTGKEVKLGDFSFICHVDSDFEEMDRLEGDPIAVNGIVSVEVLKKGEFIGEYLYIDVAYDKIDGFDILIEGCDVVDECGDSIDEESLFGDELPKVYGILLAAIKSACKNIEPNLKAFIDEIEQEC